MAFELPILPYPLDGLEPHISRNTMEFHYGKHHRAYVTTLNSLLPGTSFEKADLETIIRKADGGIFNNGAQVWNHSFYFLTFSPHPETVPRAQLMEAVKRDFGSLDELKEAFSTAAATLFGSGWVWLVQNEEGRLDIIRESNAGNPLRSGLKPLLACDVWEHAYYLDYQNRRPDYIRAFWHLIDWGIVSGRFEM